MQSIRQQGNDSLLRSALFNKDNWRGKLVVRLISRTAILFFVCCLSSLCYAQSAGDAPPQVRVRVFLETALDPSLRLSPVELVRLTVPREGTLFELLDGDGAAATTQVAIVAVAAYANAALTAMLRIEDGGQSVVSVSTNTITLIPIGRDIHRAQFALKAVAAGHTTVTITVMDKLGGKDAVRIRVVVDPPTPPPRILAPMDGALLSLSLDSNAATTQVAVLVEAISTNTEITMTVRLDAGGQLLVSVPTRAIVLTPTKDDTRLQMAQFELQALEQGRTTVTIVVVDAQGNGATVRLHVAVDAATVAPVDPPTPPPRILAPTDGDLLSLSLDSDAATTQVAVLVEAISTNTEITMTVRLDAGGQLLVSVPTRAIVLTPTKDDARLQMAQFELQALEQGRTAVTIVVVDGSGNEATVKLRVAVNAATVTPVKPPTPPPRILIPTDGSFLNLSSDNNAATTQVTVLVATPNTNTAVTMTVNLGAGGQSVVSVSARTPVLTPTEDDDRLRMAQFELQALSQGYTTVTIVVADDLDNEDTVRLGVTVDALRILVPMTVMTINPLRGGGAEATTQIKVVVEEIYPPAVVAMNLGLEDGGQTVAAVPSDTLYLAPTDNDTTRTIRFPLQAVGAGATTAVITVEDNLGNRDTMVIRVVVEAIDDEACTTCPEMVIVPPGTFTMGSPESEIGRHSSYEEPQHRVVIRRAFAVGKYEVTRGQFAAFIDATGYDAGSAWLDPLSDPFVQDDDHPVTYISWVDAQNYVSWLSKETGRDYRLLSETEWEYVARAGTTTPYHFGATISPQQARFNHTTGISTSTVAVGSYPANAFGLHDIHGNIFEWVEDCWHHDYTGAPADGSAWTSRCNIARARILRGGSWYDQAGTLRSAYRARISQTGKNRVSGFRIARTLGYRDRTRGPLQIISPTEGMVFNPLRGGGNAATTQVKVIIETIYTHTSATMDLRLDDGGETVVSIPANPIVFAPTGVDTIHRMSRFGLTALSAGHTTVTIAITDNLGNRDEVKIRVEVATIAGDDCSTCPITVIVPPGTFLMGSPEGETNSETNEKPQHRVTISRAFAVGKYEVTLGQFRAFIDATGYYAENCWRNPGGFEYTNEHPVLCVSWLDAMAYIDWLSRQTGKNYRLLSEAEWEYVARAGTVTPYYFGEAISPQDANYHSNIGGTAPVNSYRANRFGLHNVHGNAWEWVADCWHRDYNSAPNYDSAPTDGSVWDDVCPEDKVFHVRGGSYLSKAEFLRSANRSSFYQDQRVVEIGFRIARTLE